MGEDRACPPTTLAWSKGCLQGIANEENGSTEKKPQKQTTEQELTALGERRTDRENWTWWQFLSQGTALCGQVECELPVAVW